MGKWKYAAKFFVWDAGNRFEVCYIPNLASNEATKKNALEGNSGEIPGRGRHRTVGPLLKLKSFAWCHGPDIPFGVFFSGHPFGFSPASGEHYESTGNYETGLYPS